MRKNTLSAFLAKVALSGVLCITAAKGVFAQITLDLDVLTDEPSSAEKAPDPRPDTERKPFLSLKEPQTETAKTKKAAVKRPKPPKKPIKKAAPDPSEKFRVRETLKKDDHDKLKPHAAPVPQVKVLATNDTAEPEEEEISPEKNPPEVVEPKISKHFLEQQKTEAPSAKKEPEPEETLKTGFVSPPAVEKTKIKEIAPESKSLLLNFSVFPVSEKLSATERSAVLSKEIPQESATIKALTDKKILRHILIFEKKSVDLTEEMQNALDNTAALMKKEKKLRLILYSYCSPDIAEPGKERQCALRRALKIRSYMTSLGIQSLRIELRSQGQKGAGDRIPDRTDIVIQDSSF